ncbi:MAG: sodium:solute symporter family protein [Eubacteriales bacterium]|nr:sodium:solute symporter family protein [Eubacteriales bacterium]
MNTTVTIVYIVIYLAIIALLGYFGFKQTKNAQDYLIAGRKIHPFIMAMSYGATFISTSAIVGFGGAAGQLGMGLLWLTFLNIFVGIFIAFIFFGKRTRRMGKNIEAHTFPELLGQRFDSKFMQGFAGLVIFIFMPIYTAAVIKGGAEFVQTFFKISYDAALIGFVLVVALYVLLGGLKGVMYADAFQGTLMFVGMTILLVYAYSKLGGVSSAHEQLGDLFLKSDVREQVAKNIGGGFQGWTSMPKFDSPIWWNLVSTVVMGVGIGVLAQPQLAVRFMTVRSDRELNRGVVSGGIFILMMTGVAFVVGALANVNFYNETGKVAMLAAGGNDRIIPEYIAQFIPAWVGPLFLITMLAAAMSTLSSQFHTMGTAVGRDFYEKGLQKKGNSISITRIGLVIGILLSAVVAWLSGKLEVSMAVIATGTALFFGLCAASFLPAYISALYIRTMPKAAALWGMVCGFVTSAFWIFFIHEKEAASLQICRLITGKTSLVAGTALKKLAMVDPIFIALPVSLIVTFALWLILRNNKKHAMDSALIEKCFKDIA